MLALLPILAFLLGIACFRSSGHNQAISTSWRNSVLLGFTGWGTAVVVTTEGLSLFHALTRTGVACSWVFLCAAEATYLYWKRHEVQLGLPANSQRLTPLERTAIMAIVAILVLTLVVALVAAPNNYDSLTYHLPRVMHWIQNRSVAFFPTPDVRQIAFPPFAEYQILQYQILSGEDRFAALPQWFAFLQSIVATSGVAAALGASRRTQWVTALITATLPMAILQATSTQNDLVAGAWLITSVVWGLRSLQDRSLLNAGACGAAIGLSLLTKTTMCLILAPLLATWVIATVFQQKHKGVYCLFMAGILALCLNLPHCIRNVKLCGDPLGRNAQPEGMYSNQSLTIKTLVSNAARNTGLHLLAPSDRLNGFIERGIRYTHNVIGADIDNPATTFGHSRYQTKWLSTFEDDAACPLHFVLAIVLIPLGCLFLWRSRAGPVYCSLTACMLGGAALFCLILKWQPFHSRQHIALFLVASPLVAISMSRIRFAGFWHTSIVTLLLLSSVPYLLGNEVRPLLFPMTPNRFYAENILSTDRESQYLINRPLPVSWEKAVQEIEKRNCRQLGLLVEWYSCEYPLWLLLANLDKPPLVQHVCVTKMPMGMSTHDRMQRFVPDLIIQFSDTGGFQLVARPNTFMVGRLEYLLCWEMSEPGKPGAGARLYAPTGQ